MKNIICSIALLLLAFNLFAQSEFLPKESVDGEIIFSPSMTRPFYWENNNDCCRQYVIDDVDYFRVLHQNKVVILGLTVFQNYYAVKLMVGNASATTDFIFDPSAVKFDYTKDKGAIVDYKFWKTNIAENPDKLADRIQSRAAWASALATIGTSFSKPNNPVEQLRTDIKNSANTQRAANLAEMIREAGFRRNTVFPEKYVTGTVFIKKPKFQQGFFIVPIGDYQYCFTFGSFK